MAAYDPDLTPSGARPSCASPGAHGRAPPPTAVARALREVPRSAPFEALSELELVDVPALVVASHDAADPGHPYSVAAAYAESLPRARLISEEAGSSPLAWQGGRLAREIAAFCAEPEVEARARR